LSETAAIVLAAGKSTRMKSGLPKVLHEICGRPLLHYVMSACRLAGVDKLVVVVGSGKEQVQKRFAGADDVVWVEQAEQNGTGHAVQCCRKALSDFSGDVLVLAGDMPLVRRDTLASLVEIRRQTDHAMTMATTFLDDPTGYGRILRDDEENLEAIVEHSDCNAEQRKIREVNPSYYCFEHDALFDALKKIKPESAQGEYYITDTVQILRRQGQTVSAKVRAPAEDATGINSRLDLATVGRLMQDRIQLSLIDEGVTIVDPDTTWIEADVTVGQDTTIYPFSFIGAGSRIGSKCQIGPFSRIAADQSVEDGSSVGSFSSKGAGK
jgi:bifunctional UDP-N-acetylglucosamine pyrophosphorylase/glucosamine-1-phosphate N-acetyltransferase